MTHRVSVPATQGLSTVLRWYQHVIGLVFGLLIAAFSAGKLNYGDWGSLWIAGLLVRDGHREHLYSIHDRDFALPKGDVWLHTIANSDVSSFPHPFVHVPFVADVMSVIVRVMSFNTSVILLAIASGCALVVLIASAWIFWFDEQIPMAVLLIGILVGWVSMPFQSSLYLGQSSPLIFAGVAYGLAAARTLPIRAGIVLGIVAAVKLTPVALVAICLLFARSRKTGIVATGVGILIVVASILSSGWRVFNTWWQTLRELNAAALVARVNGSFASRISSGLVHNDKIWVAIIKDPPMVASVVPRILTVVLLLLVAYTAWRSQESWKIACVGTITVLTATGGILWDHYLLIAVLPLLGVLARGSERAICVVAILAILAFPPLAKGDSNLWFPWSAFAMLVGLVVVLCVAELGREWAPRSRRKFIFAR